MGKYYYVPSTYKGKKFRRKRRRGGAFSGCGRICGGSLVDLSPQVVNVPTVTPSTPVDIPVAPAQIEQNLLAFPEITDEMIEKARKIIALAEATGKAQPITKKEAGIWSGLKNLGSKIWSGVKTVASNPAVQFAAKTALPFALGALTPAALPYVQKGLDYVGQKIQPGLDYVGKYAYDQLKDRYKGADMVDGPILENVKDAVVNTALIPGKMVANTGSAIANGAKGLWNWMRGNGRGGAYRAGAYRAGAYRAGAYRAGAYRGCGRKGRLKKGSPEAKAYMAMLRSMRGKKKRTKSTKRGGMFRGVTENALLNIYEKAINAGKNSATVNWRDEQNRIRSTNVPIDKLENMLNGTYKMKNFYSIAENGKVRTKAEEKAFRSDFLKENYGIMSQKYKEMGSKRRKRLQRQIFSLNDRFSKAKLERAKNYWKNRAYPELANVLAEQLDNYKTAPLEPRMDDIEPLIFTVQKPKKRKKMGVRNNTHRPLGKKKRKFNAMLKKIFHKN